MQESFDWRCVPEAWGGVTFGPDGGVVVRSVEVPHGVATAIDCVGCLIQDAGVVVRSVWTFAPVAMGSATFVSDLEVVMLSFMVLRMVTAVVVSCDGCLFRRHFWLARVNW